MSASVIPPALSTTQDDSIEFAKVTEDDSKEQSRVRFGPNYKNSPLREVISNYYSLDKLAEYLSTKDGEQLRFKKICLQFPDDLVCDSAIVCDILQQKLQQEVWVLADTSYSPCCVDEVAAEHVNADMVVHFGDACLQPVEKVQTAYIFGHGYVDLDKAVQTVKKQYAGKDSVCLMADTPYSWCLGELRERLKDDFSDVVFAAVDVSRSGRVIDGVATEKGLPIKSVSRIVDGMEDPKKYPLFYLGQPPAPKLLLLSTLFSGLTVVDPFTLEVSHETVPALSRRYRFMMVARNAATIGVLVNTLSLQNTRDLLNRVVKQIKKADKKHYMFVVGKPNVAKLANFDTIDVWCILGCGQSGIVIDQYNEYFKPIITPYELELALEDEITWTGKWKVDFDEVMQKEDEEDDDEEVTENPDDDPYAPTFDPVTGTLVSSKPLRQLRHLQVELESQGQLEDDPDKANNQLATRFTSAVTLGNTVSTSALHFQERQWGGLGSDWKDDEEHDEEGAVVEQGRTGIARDYDYDRGAKK